MHWHHSTTLIVTVWVSFAGRPAAARSFKVVCYVISGTPWALSPPRLLKDRSITFVAINSKLQTRNRTRTYTDFNGLWAAQGSPRSMVLYLPDSLSAIALSPPRLVKDRGIILLLSTPSPKHALELELILISTTSRQLKVLQGHLYTVISRTHCHRLCAQN